jgi:hypothetical protein
MKLKRLPAAFVVPAQPVKAPAGTDWVHEIKPFTQSIALTEMIAAVWGIAAPNAEPRGRNARAAADCAPLPFSFAHSPKT